MTPLIFSKFKHYIYFPDFANRFLISSLISIPSFKQYKVNFEYIFSIKNSLSSTPLRAITNLEAIYPKRPTSSSNIIILRYTKSRCHSIIRLTLNLEQFASFFSYFAKKPFTLEKIFNTYIKSTKHFFFPGFISKIQYPKWKRNVLLSFKELAKNNQRNFLIHTSAFIN